MALTWLAVIFATIIGLHICHLLSADGRQALVSTMSDVIGQESPFSEQQIVTALVSGALVALTAFGVLAVYNSVRSARRGDLQLWWHEIYSGLIKPLFGPRKKQ